MTDTPNLVLPYIAAAQAQKHVTHNEAIRLLDGMVQLSVLSRTLTAPPGSPTDGSRYIVASGATGLWAGWDLNVAFWVDGAWLRLIPRPGWLAWSVADSAFYSWSGSAWVVLSTGGSVFSDTAFFLQDNADATKQAQFELSGITTGTTRVITVPNASGTLALLGTAQTFTGAQTFSAATNSFGTSAAASTTNVASGATTTGNTKAVNIGTAGASGSTTNIVLGSAVAGALGSLTINSPTVAFGATVSAFNMPDSVARIQNTADPTKQVQFDLSGLAPSSLVTLTAPAASGVLVTTAGTQTLTNKSISASQITGLASVATLGTFASLTGIPTTVAGYGISDAVDLGSTQTITGAKTFSGAVTFSGTETLIDSGFTLADDVDNTKKVKFELSGVGTGSTVLLTVPSSSGSLITSGMTLPTIGNSAAATTMNLASGAATSGVTKLVNIGPNGLSGSTTNVAIGSAVSGALGTLTINTPTTNFGATATAFQVPDSVLQILGSADATKKAVFEVDGFTTGTTRTFTLPDATTTLVGSDTAQTLTNKSIAATQLTGTVALANGGTGFGNGVQAFGGLFGYRSTVTSASTVTLTNADAPLQVFTGSTAQTVAFPTAANVLPGGGYFIDNQSSADITVNASSGGNITTVKPGQTVWVYCTGSAGGGPALWATRVLAAPQFTATAMGVVPASGGGTTNFLRADGTWAAPAGGGGGLTFPQAFALSSLRI